MKHHVLGLVDEDEQAQKIAQELTSAGFSKEDIFMWSSHLQFENDLASRKQGDPDEPRFGSEGVGLLSGIGPKLADSAGRFMAADKIMGAAESGEANTVSGSLVRFGLSDNAAQSYESKLKDGTILIAVRVGTQEMANAARKIFESSHGQEVLEI